jgi:hypothetical protein
MPPEGGFGEGLIRNWSPQELNVWRRVESAWVSLNSPDIELQRLQTDGSDWEYGAEATAFLNALDHFFEQIGPRVQSEGINWHKGVFTQNLSRFEDRALLQEASLWDSITFLRAVTRFSRFPDNNDGGWFADHFATGGVKLAMARLNYLTAPAVEDVERILAFKPIFDSLSVRDFRAWQGGDRVELEEGGEAIHVPWPQYHPVVHEWSEAVYETVFYIDPYHGIKEGKPIPDPKFLNIGEQDHPSPSNFFAKANLATTRQYMAVCIRGEKWCDGFIAREFERGVIQAAFNRLGLMVEGNR